MSELRTSLTDAARRAGGALTRRATLLALGGAALVAAPAAAKGGDGAKAGKKARKACKRQGEQCRRLVISICNGDPECIDGQLRCCAFFATCKAAPGFACFDD